MNLQERCFIYRVSLDGWQTQFDMGAITLDSGSAEAYILNSYPSASIKYGGDVALVAPPRVTYNEFD